jgi:hypothetical protein
MKRVIFLILITSIGLFGQTRSRLIDENHLTDSLTILRAADANIRSSVDSLVTVSNEYRDSINALSARSTNNLSRVEVLEDSSGSWTPQFNTLKGRVSVNEDSLTDHTSQFNILKGRVTVNEDSVSDISSRSLVNSSSISVLDDTADVHTTQIDNLNAFKSAQIDTNQLFPKMTEYTPKSALKYNGTDAYSEIQNSFESTVQSGEVSFSLWVKAGDGNGTSIQYILGSRNGTDGILGVNITTSGDLKVSLYSNGVGSEDLYVPNVFIDGENDWKHIVITIKSDTVADGVTIYINGDKQALQSSSTSGIIMSNYSNSLNLYLGNWNYITSLPFNGQLSNVHIFNKVLSSTEASQLWNQGLGLDELPDTLRTNNVLDLNHSTATAERWTDLSLNSNDAINYNTELIGQFKKKLNSQNIAYTDSTSTPPTDAELDAIFGEPSSNNGAIYHLDVNGADTNVYQIFSNGTSWFILTMTKGL